MVAELPEGWSQLSIQQATTKCTSGYWGDDAPGEETLQCRVIRNGDVRKDTTVEKDLPCRYFKPREVKKARVVQNDVILVTSGAYTGTVARIRESDVVHPTVASNFVRLIRGNGKTDGEFLGHLLSSRLAQAGFVGFIGGSAIPNLQSAAYRLLKLPFPPLPEQRKIAAILSSVDDAIAATRKVIDQSKRVKQGLLQILMTRGIGHTRFKRTEIGEIPKAWEVRRLDDLGRRGTQTVRTGPFGSSLKGEHFSERGRPVLTIQSLGEGRIEDEGLFFVPPEKANELKEYEVRTGDLVFSRVADIGRSVVIDPRAEGWIISSNLIRISVDPGRVNPWYLMHCIVGGGPVTKQIARLAGDQGRPVVSSTMLKDLRFPLAPKEEQDEIVSRLAALEDARHLYEKQVFRLGQTKRGLMQDLLTGRVRVERD